MIQSNENQNEIESISGMAMPSPTHAPSGSYFVQSNPNYIQLNKFSSLQEYDQENQ